MKYDAVIVGGGAAGMLAAITSARRGKNILLLERNDRLGRKLMITGKGRCNLTNNCDIDVFMKNIPCNGRFLYSAFSQFSATDLMDFFEHQLGVPLKTERGNRVFPESDKAMDIVDAMKNAMKREGVCVKTERATSLIIKDNVIFGVKTDKSEYQSNSVLIATGGKSYPATGSTGDGYELAKQAVHTIVPLRPSLVPIVCTEAFCSDLMGLSLKNVKLTLRDKTKSKVIYTEQGEMLFTHFGVSGPLVLSASAHINDLQNELYVLEIDLKPALNEEKLDIRILRDFSEQNNKDFINSLGKLLPTKLIPIIAEQSGIPPDIKVNQITKAQRRDLVKILKNFTLTVKRFRPIDEAVITGGGVAVNEISPKTMESKLVSGLFFAGEVIDVDGYTGGFNLQIAFSTGYVAGMNCAE